MVVVNVNKLVEVLNLQPAADRAMRGDEFKVFCPFHSDTDPSMSINVKKELWQCFGACHIGGTVTQLAARILNVSAGEARKILVDSGAVENADHTVPRGQKLFKPYDPTPHPKFEKPLPNGVPILSPLPRVRPDGTYSYLPTKILLRYGVYTSIDDAYFDEDFDAEGRPRTTRRHNKRIIIPLHNELGEIVGFQARGTEEWHKPKYLFSNGTEAHRIVYNYHRVEDSEYLYVVEGVFGVMHFANHMVNNTVALMGSQLSRKKIDLLKGHKLIICLDYDDAGNKCAGAMEDHPDLTVVTRYIVPPGIEHDTMPVKYFLDMRKQVLTAIG